MTSQGGTARILPGSSHFRPEPPVGKTVNQHPDCWDLFVLIISLKRAHQCLWTTRTEESFCGSRSTNSLWKLKSQLSSVTWFTGPISWLWCCRQDCFTSEHSSDFSLLLSVLTFGSFFYLRGFCDMDSHWTWGFLVGNTGCPATLRDPPVSAFPGLKVWSCHS